MSWHSRGFRVPLIGAYDAERCWLTTHTGYISDSMDKWRRITKKITKITNKLLKVTISQKPRMTQKISFMQELSARSIPIYSANLPFFEESLIFGKVEFGRLCKRDMMWYAILHMSFFLAYCASFMSRWPLLMEGGGSADP